MPPNCRGFFLSGAGMIVTIDRDTFTPDTTAGQMSIDGKHFCYTLEDAARAEGVKIAGKTCIPAGQYTATVSMSGRFKREMVMLSNTDKEWIIESGGISFSGIRCHGGNDHEDTHGCVLVARNRISDDKIQGSMEQALTALVKNELAAGGVVLFEINNSQSNEHSGR